MLSKLAVSIGWVIFWKCVVVGVWAGIAARWAAYRKRRHEEGLSLKQNRDGVYVVSDWTRHVDTGAIWIRNAVYGFTFALWTVMGGTYVFFGREPLERAAQWLIG